MQTNIGAVGARAIFTGAVREDDGVETLFLEHYPGMTETALENITDQALERWPLLGVTLIHRIGTLNAGEEIVLVITAASHRTAAYEANCFLMDHLKTCVPLWKRESGATFERWVESTTHDRQVASQWRRSFSKDDADSL